MNQVNRNSPWRNPWVLLWIGLLLAFFAANAVMIYLSRDNNPGLVVDDYYERGQDYEKNMLKRLAREHGWKQKILVPRKLEPGQPAPIALKLTDKEGRPVSPDSVTLYAYRPSDSKQDFSQPLSAIKPGLFQADIAFPLKGVWDLLLSVRQGEDEFNFPRRVMVGSRK